MHALPFFKLSPGGNPTLLFVARLGVEEQALVAAECLSALHLDAEQAGFVHPEKAFLRMAGGEFCLNATRCLGVLLALEGRLPTCKTDHTGRPTQWRGQARTSGIPYPVMLHVQACSNVYDCTVTLPLPFRLSSRTVCTEVGPGMVLVRLPGISHLLIDATRHPFPRNWREASARLRARHGLDQEEAAGCVWWSPLPTDFAPPNAHAVEAQALPVPSWQCEPVVAVRHPHTVYHESACGSGSLALALALAQQGMLPQGAASIVQPSGMPIRVSLEEHSTGMYAHVGGPVGLVARGEAYITALPTDAGADAEEK